VVEDGSSQGLGNAPVNVRQRLRLLKGETTAIQLQVINRAEVPYKLIGCALVLSARRKPDDDRVLLVAGTLSALLGPNWATFTLTATQLNALDAGLYLYDVALTDATNNVYWVVPPSPLTLEGTV
jgi:hypothetical protein